MVLIVKVPRAWQPGYHAKRAGGAALAAGAHGKQAYNDPMPRAARELIIHGLRSRLCRFPKRPDQCGVSLGEVVVRALSLVARARGG